MSEIVNKAKAGQYLTFQLMNEQYGVPINTVREINRVGEITPVPKTPEFVKGVMNLRGKIIPVINLRVKFGMNAQDYTRDTCIIVIDSDIGQVGMIVDSVKEVAELTDVQIEPPPILGNDANMTFVTGMGKLDNRVIILVDVVKALSHDHLSEITRINGSDHNTETEAA
jgi:purine-binding chemotaxis protein CheW